MRFTTAERLARALQLADGGVPLDLHYFTSSSRLIIRQFGADLENSVFDLPHGICGFIISLCVTINCSLIGISNFHLEVPWEIGSVHWLPDPAVAQNNLGLYSFPGGDKFDRALVINHLANLSRKYRKGDFFQGYLLGFSDHAIPVDIKHGQQIPAFVAISDQYESRSITPISLFADRTQKNRRIPGGVSRQLKMRGPLLAKKDAPVGSYR
jgi:hypothetical protein